MPPPPIPKKAGYATVASLEEWPTEDGRFRPPHSLHEIAATGTMPRNAVEPRYNEGLGTMKITLLYRVSHYIRVKKQKYKDLGPAKLPCFCYFRPLYNEVPL